MQRTFLFGTNVSQGINQLLERAVREGAATFHAQLLEGPMLKAILVYRVSPL